MLDIKELEYTDNGCSIRISDNQVAEVSDAFTMLCGYTADEIMGMNIKSLMRLLRINTAFNLIKGSFQCCIFTRYLDAKIITITISSDTSGIDRIVNFSPSKSHQLKNNFLYLDQLYKTDIQGVAIFYSQDLILMRANQIFLNIFSTPFNQKECSFGLGADKLLSKLPIPSLSDKISAAINSASVKILKNVELICENLEKRYFNFIITPIYELNNLNYLIITAHDITKETELSLKLKQQSKIILQQRTHFNAILDKLESGVAVIDAAGNFIQKNKVFQRWVYPLEITNIRDTNGLFSYYDLEENEICLENLPYFSITQGEKIENHLFLVKGPFSDIYINFSGSPTYDESGNYSGAVFCITDVTKYIMNSKVLQERKNELEAIISHMSDGLIIINKNNEIIKLNEKGTNFYYDALNITKTGDSYKHTQYFDRGGKPINLEEMPGSRALKGEAVDSMRVVAVRPDKVLYTDISATPILDDKGHINSAVLCVRDVSEDVKYEELLKYQRDNLLNIINNLALPVIRISYPDGKLTEINEKANTWINALDKDSYLSKIKLGDNLFNTFPSVYQTVSELDNERFNNARTSTIIHNKKLKLNGNIHYIDVIVQPIWNCQNTVVEILLMCIDLTKEVEEKNAMERLMKLQEEFFSFISHEFKTPINITMTAIQAMKSICKDELSSKAFKYINKINTSALQQLRLVNNLLDITRAEAGYLKTEKRNEDIVNMTKLIVDSVSLYAREKGVGLRFVTDLTELVIGIDDEKYERILLNLLSNAIKFTPKGKTVTVKVKIKNDYLSIAVKDNGIGIPEDKQRFIFNKFSQVDNTLIRNSEGTGIGLCLVKLLVNILGGEIYLKSSVGKGSTFEILLPMGTVSEEDSSSSSFNLSDDRLIQAINVEFSNIYDY